MKLPKFTLSTFVACATLAIMVARAEAQTIYTWNNTGTNFSSAGSWSPTGGPPGTGDIVQFTPAGTPLSNSVMQPTIDTNRTVTKAILGPSPLLSGWTFSGSSTLTVGSAGTSFGLHAYGPATYTFDGPSIQGTPGVNMLFNVTSGSTVALQGNSTAAANTGTTYLHGGTLLLDNSINNVADRFPGGSAFNFLSGTLELRGNTSAATSFALGPITINGGNFTGTNTIRLVPGGAVNCRSISAIMALVEPPSRIYSRPMVSFASRRRVESWAAPDRTTPR